MMKKCKSCKKPFTPRFKSTERYCWDDDCKAIEVKLFFEAKAKAAKKQLAKEKSEAIERTKTKKDYEKDLEKVFNHFIRLRDIKKPCISCGKNPPYTITAGHYFPAGSYKNIRFDEMNVHGQCWWNCNKNQHGNLINYRVGLIERIGLEELESLERRSIIEAHFSIPELKEMIVKYKLLTKPKKQ